jgi:hypothetical protein
VVALLTTFVVGFAGSGFVLWYSRRRSPDATLSWGEAMAAAMFAMFMFFWWYGVIPHQWMLLADSEWNWGPDRFFAGPGGIVETILPFEISYMIVRDFVVLGIYGVGLGLHIFHWAHWNDRKKKAAAAPVPASQYGRPLVKKA